MKLRTSYITLSLIGLTLLLGACSKYQLTLNDQVMYTPAPLFTQFTTSDPDLRNCLDQAIKDQKATSAAQVKILNCSNAGISSLNGLEIFTGLEQINLANNKLQHITSLAKLDHIKVLKLNNNALVSVAELVGKESLTDIDLSHNPALSCEPIKALYLTESQTPKQCL